MSIKKVIERIKFYISEGQASYSDELFTAGHHQGTVKGLQMALAIILEELGDGAWADVRRVNYRPFTCGNCHLGQYENLDESRCRILHKNCANDEILDDCPAWTKGGGK